MLEVLSLLVVLVMSLIITRVATVALTLTGMSQPVAQFQARSALTGAGFTTHESERVVSHPLRRRIIMALMLIGNTGLVLGASLVILLMSRSGGDMVSRTEQFGLLVGGLLALYLVARSAWVERMLRRGIERLLRRHTDLGRRDYGSLLRLGGGYRVAELNVESGDWMAGHTLGELDLPEEGILVLGITRGDSSYVGAPRGETRIDAEDTVMLYGTEERIAALDQRRAGVGGHLQHVENVAQARAERSGDGEPEPTRASGPGHVQPRGRLET
ncbi:MAG TPA: TrkA C-terminal domain-containing protein [Myxococcota bacterium]|nr:TrkA C-terminal domain-containing protein [Myxococcota bacterium]